MVLKGGKEDGTTTNANERGREDDTTRSAAEAAHAMVQATESATD
jgi:hypothetical protein